MLTLKITTICAVLGFSLGIILALVEISEYKPLIWFRRFYASIFRGVSLLVQLYIVHFGLPQLLGFTLAATQSGILTLTLDSATHVPEVSRGGVMGIDKGQYGASISLGIGYEDMMKDVIVPQAVKHILPSLVNEAIALLKGSSVLPYIDTVELLRTADQITVLTFRFLKPYLVIVVIYYVSVMILSAIASRLERWVNRSDRAS